MSFSRRVWALYLLLALLAGAALYWPWLRNPTFFDDTRYFQGNALNEIFIQGFSFTTRWLPYFVTAWIDLIFDDKIFAQRVFSLALHLTTAYVLYALIKQISSHAAPHHNNERAAIVAALLFVLHPLAVYAAGYLIQRTILMATLFGLLSLNTYFDGLTSRKKGYFIFSALFYFLSAYSKEHALLLPAAALALTPLAVAREALFSRETLQRVLLPVALYTPIFTLVVLEKLSLLGRPYEPLVDQLLDIQDVSQDKNTLWLLSVMTQAALYFKYLLLTLVPNPDWMSVDMRAPFARQLAEPKYIAAVIAVAAYGGVAVRSLMKRGRAGVAGYALLAPLLMFCVEFSTVRIQEPFVLYRTYLWVPFLFLLVPVLTNGIQGRIFWPLMLGIALLLAVASTDRLRSFSSDQAIWDDAVKKLPDTQTPGAARAYNNRGRARLRSGDAQGAIDDCTRAIASYDKYQTAYQVRAFAHLKLGDHQAAIRDAQTVAKLFPHDVNAFTLLGVMYRGAGQLDKAIENLEVACSRKSFTACYELKVAEALLTESGNTQKP